MLSISDRGSAKSAEQYYEHLAQDDDYYLRGEEPPGQWSGRGAAVLGLAGAVSPEQFRALLRGNHPESGEALVQAAGDEHRAGWDLTFSAPKSVSVLWSQLDAESRARLEAAHTRAVSAAVGYLERHAAYTRRGKQGLEAERLPGLVVAQFQHHSSRELDPQLHTHCFVLNVAQREDGTHGSIESRHLYRRKMAAGALYRAELAAELQRIGLAVERARESFRLRDVPHDIERPFSQRRGQIEQALVEHGGHGAKASEIAALATRRAKEPHARADLFQAWQDRGRALGFGPEAARVVMASPTATPPAALPTARELLEQLTQNSATFLERDLCQAVAVAAQGVRDAQGIEAYVREVLASDEVVRLRATGAGEERRYTTRSMLALERRIQDLGRTMAKQRSHVCAPAQLGIGFESRPTLSQEQLTMVRHVCSNTGALALVQGDAGTGKSFALGAAREAWETRTLNVRGAALSAKAARALQDGSGIPSQTLHSLLAEIDERGLSPLDVVVVDEAGMVGTRQLARLMEAVSTYDAKLVLVGDTKQLQPIDAGAPFRGLLKQHGAAELTDIRRQHDDWARESVREFARGDAAKALAAYKERGLLVVENDHQQLMRRVVADWHETRAPDRPGAAVILTGTRSEAYRLNQLARAAVRETLGSGVTVQTDHGPREFREGDRVLFTRNSRELGVENGRLGTVVRVSAGKASRLTVALDDDAGRPRQDDAGRVRVEVGEGPGQYAAIDHGYAMTVHKAQGATVDRAFVVLNETMTDRALTYVAASRARVETRLYCSSDVAEDLDRLVSRTREQDAALDHAVERDDVPPAKATPKAEPVAEPEPDPEPELEQ